MTTVQLKIPYWLDILFAWPFLIYRRYKYGYTYRKIILTEDKYAKVDQKDYYWLNSFKWIVFGNKNNFYAVRNEIVGPYETKIVFMHRQIMNFPKGLLVDHRNCESLDNRRANLRNATPSQNMQNRRKKKNTTSQYRSVWKLKNGKWESQIFHQGKKIWLGHFENEIDAAKAYDAMAKKLRGEFARLNFPEETSSS